LNGHTGEEATDAFYDSSCPAWQACCCAMGRKSHLSNSDTQYG